MAKRSKRILIALLLVGGILAAGYAAAPTVLEYLAVRYAGSLVEIRNLEIESVGPRQTVISNVRLNNKQMRLDAQQIDVNYALWPFHIQGLSVKRASLDIKALPAGSGGGAGVPLPPLSFPVRIDSLDIDAGTPWGEVSIPVSISSGPGESGGMKALVESRRFTLDLSNPEPNRHALVLLDARGTRLLSANITAAGFPVSFEGRFDPAETARWSRDADAVPAGLKKALSPYGVSGAGFDFDGILNEDGGFDIRLSGDTRIEDNHDVSDRLFDSVTIHAGPGYTIKHHDDAWSGDGDAEVALSLVSGDSVSGKQPSWRWDDNGLSFNLDTPEVQPLGVSADSVEFDTPSFNTEETGGRLAVKQMAPSWWPGTLNLYDIDGRWTWRGSSFQAAGEGTGEALPVLHWTVDTGDDRGNVEVTSKTEASRLQRALVAYAPDVTRNLKIDSGTLDGRYDLRWDADGQQSTLRLTADSVDADLDEMAIRGLKVGLSNQGRDITPLSINITAPALQLAAGTVAEDLDIKLHVSPPELRIDKAETRLFEGAVSVRPDTLRLDDKRYAFNVDIDRLSLEKLMTLLELESTSLTGTIAGPVHVVYEKGKGLEVNEGKLHNLEPGVLRFTLSPGSEETAQINNIALRALQDFQYDELNASLLYKPDGEYRISARIVGRNPKVLDGHPIAFNPTIEGRLPALFRAFFLTGDFSQAIIDRLREEQNSSSPGETSTLDQD